MRRWNSNTMITTGIVTTTEAAMIAVIGDWNCDCPVKKVSAAGTVRDRVGRGERRGEQEFVPAEEEREDRRREHARRGHRHDHLPERLPLCRPIDLRGLLHLPRDLAEERRHRPDRQRQGEREVRDDQTDPGVVDPQPAPHVEQRTDECRLREHGDRQRHRQQHLLEREVEPGDRVGGEHGDDDRQRRGDDRDAERVLQGRREQLVTEDRVVVLPRPVLRKERRRRTAERAGILERQRHHPREWERRPHEDQEPPHRPPHAGLAIRSHQPSPRTCDRSVLKPLMKMNAITTTVKNSSTDTADPAPRFTSVTFWR